MRIAPPQKVLHQEGFKKSLIAATLILAFNSTYAADNFIYKLGITNYNPKANFILKISKDNTIATEYQNIDIELAPPIDWNRYTVAVYDGLSLKVNGNTSITLDPYTIENPGDNSGSNALFAVGTGGDDPKISKIELSGDVSIDIKHPFSEDEDKTVGANGVYAREYGEIYLGSSGTTTKIQTIALKPDAISAKNGGKVFLNSLDNQIIGSIDFIYYGMGTKNSVVEGTFSGNTAYWFGDDQSVMNAEISYNGISYVGKEKIETLYQTLDTLRNLTSDNSYIQKLINMAKAAWESLQLTGTEINDELNLTFSN